MSNTPVIGYVIKRFPRLSETFILEELLALERLGLDIVVFALGHPREPIVHADYGRLRARVVYADDALPPGVHEGTALRATGMSKAAARLAPWVSLSGVTHLHAHFATSAATVARELAERLSLSYSVTAHAKDIFHESVSREDLAPLMRDAAFVVTVSDFNVRHLEQLGRREWAPIHRIYNGIDLAAYEWSPPTAGPGSPHGNPRATPSVAERVLAVGRLVDKKGFDVFVDALALLRARRPSVEGALIGTGPCEADLRSQRAARGLDQHLAMPGALPRHQVLAAMRAHSVLAAPCVVATNGDRDGLPTVLIEAMAVGLPVVATPVTGVPEIVRHGHTGLLVPERNPEALADALEHLLTDDATRLRVARGGRALVEREFDANRAARQLAALFDSTVSSRAQVYAGTRHSEAAAR